MASNFKKRFVERGKKRANISRALEMTRHELNLLEREKKREIPSRRSAHVHLEPWPGGSDATDKIHNVHLLKYIPLILVGGVEGEREAGECCQEI
jgi:hypothetical protein